MSGHSKWHSIKHKKGAADTRARQALRRPHPPDRGGRPVREAATQESNTTLRTMVQKARDASVPVDTIHRGIRRGTGEEEGVVYEPVNYEGYAPHGVAVFVQALTDNRNRTGAEIKNIFPQQRWFVRQDRRGLVAVRSAGRGDRVDKKNAGEDDLMLVAADAGADDIVDMGDLWQVTTPPTELHTVRTAIEAAGIAVKESDLTMVADHDRSSWVRSRYAKSVLTAGGRASRITTTSRRSMRTSTYPNRYWRRSPHEWSSTLGRGRPNSNLTEGRE